MLELFGANTGNCLRAAIALEEADLSFVPRVVDLRGGEQQSPSFLELNPAGKAPVLVDRNHSENPIVLTQSNAIMFYAAAQGAPRRLLPDEGPSRTRALERYFYFLTDVIGFSQAAFYLRGQDAAGALESELIERLEASERFLADGPYMAGDAFSLADVAGFTMALAYRRRLDWRPDCALVQWYARVEARPAVQRGLNAFRHE